MTTAFWDSSALVALCVEQQPSSTARELLRQYDIAVWWATSVEMRSAFQRLLRTGSTTAEQNARAGARLQQLRRTWLEIQPGEELRSKAERFLESYPLKAADALQLAAAWVWCSGRVQTCVFISGDVQLLDAAGKAGFRTISL